MSFHHNRSSNFCSGKLWIQGCHHLTSRAHPRRTRHLTKGFRGRFEDRIGRPPLSRQILRGALRGFTRKKKETRSDAKSAKEQRFDEGRPAEDATPTAAVVEANHGTHSCENMDNASMSPGESNNASTAGLPSSSFVSSGHQQANAPRQSQTSFIRQRSSERQDSQTQQRHDHTNSASHLLSAVIRRNTSVLTDPNRFQASEVIYDLAAARDSCLGRRGRHPNSNRRDS